MAPRVSTLNYAAVRKEKCCFAAVPKVRTLRWRNYCCITPQAGGSAVALTAARQECQCWGSREGREEGSVCESDRAGDDAGLAFRWRWRAGSGGQPLTLTGTGKWTVLKASGGTRPAHTVISVSLTVAPGKKCNQPVSSGPCGTAATGSEQ